jgi:hypothetical protein
MNTEETKGTRTVIDGPYHLPGTELREQAESKAWLGFRTINNLQNSCACEGLCCRWILKRERNEHRLVAAWTDNGDLGALAT